MRRSTESGLYSANTTTRRQRGELAEDGEVEEDTRVYRASPAEGVVAGGGEGAVPAAQAAVALRDARPLLGQDALVAELGSAIERAFQTRTARLIAIEGEPGAGKTRMLQRASELAAALGGDVDVHYAALRSRDDGPYAPISRLLLDRFGITPASSPAVVRREMEGAVAEVVAVGTEAEAEATAHLLGHLAGVPFPGSARLSELSGDPAALHENASAALSRFVSGETSKRPQLWLLDDISDADAGVFAVLGALCELDVPIAIAIAGTPPLFESLGASAAKERGQRLVLRQLDAAEVERLTTLLVPDLAALPEELATVLLHRSRGVPGQLVELIRGLQDGGLFQRGEQGVFVDLARLARGGLPLTIADSIRARIATLPTDALEVVRDAAMIGEHFWDGALLALRRARAGAYARELPLLELFSPNDDELALQRALDTLEAKGFVVLIGDTARPGRSEYTFQHAGTRAVVYAELDPTEAVRSHAVVARWMTLSSGIARESLPALLAPHLERSGAPQLAARAYLDAARDERARMRTTMALLYAERALALIDAEDVSTRIEALHQRGALLSALGRYPEAFAEFETIVRAAWAVGAHGRAGAALNRIARIHRERGEYAQALDHLRAALELFDRIDDQPGVASSYDDMAQLHRMRSEFEPALAAAKRALAIRVRLHDRRGQGVSLNTMGRIELDLGRYEAAEGRFRTALKIRRGIDDHEGSVQTGIALGQLAFRRGQHAEAVRVYLDALEGARELSHARFQSYALHYLGVAYLALDELDRAESALREAKALASGLRDRHGLPEIEHNLAALAERRQGEKRG